jgi:exopolysaccharide biosynthesis polyprenyl glycosylphosphotransferase
VSTPTGHATATTPLDSLIDERIQRSRNRGRHAQDAVMPLLPRRGPRPVADERIIPTLDPVETFLHGADVQSPRRDSLRRRGLAVADLFAILLAYALMWVFATPPTSLVSDSGLVVLLPLWVVLNKVLGLYDRDASLLHKSTLDELPKIAHSIFLGTGAIYMFGPLFLAFALLVTPLLRTAVRGLIRRTTPAERVLILGSGQVASMVARKIVAHPEFGAELVGYVDVSAEHHVDHGAPVPLLGEVADFEAICKRNDVERVIVAFSSLPHEHLLNIIRVSKRLKLKISVVPRLFEVLGHSVEIDQIEGMTLLGMRPLNRTKSSLVLKRTIDVAGAVAMLVLLAPVLAVIALAVKLTSRGPVLFVQRRIGRGNEAFPMLKFRTMVVGADQMKADLAHLNEVPGGTMFKIAGDPRITPLGRVLRRLSLDELPQLWNVLRGEMSLVGPRPLVPHEDGHVIGWHRARLELTPGLTGPWQVLGRNAIPFDEMVKIDYLYVAEWSLWNDVKLLLRTLPVVLGRTGA